MDNQVLLKMLTPPTKKVDVVIDTDAYNEIDDQFAVSYALCSPDKMTVKALYAAPFFNARSSSPADGMEKSYNEILKLLDLAERVDLKAVTFRGAEGYLENETTPCMSEAVRDLIDRARGYTSDDPLYVIALGAITNVASALIAAPDIIDRIVIIWLGGHVLHWNDTAEFNMKQDVAAARVIFGSGAPVVQFPCMGCVSEFRLSKPELEYWFIGKNPLADYLARNTIEEAERYAHGKPWTRVIWDATTIAYLIDANRLLATTLEHAPIPEYDHHYAFSSRRHFIRYVTQIKRDALMEDMIKRICK